MQTKILVDKLIKDFGQPYSEKLDIDLKKSDGIFKWFLASVLFGKPIGENSAIKTYKCFEKYDILTPEKILNRGWQGLVDILDEGSYTRYDFSTSDKLLEIMKKLKGDYGSLDNLYKISKNSKDLEKRLQEFKGIGPTTTNVFLRELRVVWKKVDSEPCVLVKLAAKNLGIDLKKFNRKSEKFIKLECALLRLGKDFCRKKKCKECEFKQFCLTAKL